MTRICLRLVALVALLGATAQAAERSPVTAQLRQWSLDVLRANLEAADHTTSTDAAQFLLSLGYPERIVPLFETQLTRSGINPVDRVQCWSVLARSVEAESRQPWLDQLWELVRTGPPDERSAAALALAELEAPLRDEQVPQLNSVLAQSQGELLAHLQWIRLNSGIAEAEGALTALLASDDSAVRAAAATALSRRSTVSTETWTAMLAAIKREATDAPTRASLIAALGAHSLHRPHKAAPFDEQLRAYAKTGSEAEQRLAYFALARIATPEDLPLLIAGLDSPSAEVRSVAAWAILRLGRRVSPGLSRLDWSIIALYVLGMLAVGWYYARQNRSTEEYLLGNRQMKPLNVGLSLFAGLVSVLSYLAWPGEVIKYGPLALCIYLAHPLIYLVVGYLLIPYIMKLRVTTAYELLETRLGVGVRLLGSCFFLALRLGWMSVIVYAATTNVLIPLAGLPPASAPWICAALALVTITYTTMGGIRAVVLTDVIQTAILFTGAIVTLGVITVELGGMAAWWPTAWVPHWPVPVWTFNSTARVTALGAAFGSFVWWICTSGSDQMAIQRYLATRDANAARRVMAVTLISDFVVGMFLAVLGLALLGYFRVNPQCLPDGPSLFSNADQLFPRFITIGLPTGFSGLVVAGLLAGAMSALSAGLNASCSVITVDLLDRFLPPRGQAIDPVKRLRYVSLVVGLIVVFLSSFVGTVHGNLLEICYKVVNLLTAPLFGLFFLAMFVRWATGFGTLVGAVFGVATVVLVNYWQELTGMPGISFFWGIPLSLSVEVAVGALVSLLPVGQRPRQPVDVILPEASDA